MLVHILSIYDTPGVFTQIWCMHIEMRTYSTNPHIWDVSLQRLCYGHTKLACTLSVLALLNMFIYNDRRSFITRFFFITIDCWSRFEWKTVRISFGSRLRNNCITSSIILLIVSIENCYLTHSSTWPARFDTVYRALELSLT